MKDKKKDTWYPLFTKSRGDDSEKTFNQSLPKEIQTALGKSINELFDDTNTALQDQSKTSWLKNRSNWNKRNKGLLSHRNSGATWTLSPIRSEIRMPG